MTSFSQIVQCRFITERKSTAGTAVNDMPCCHMPSGTSHEFQKILERLSPWIQNHLCTCKHSSLHWIASKPPGPVVAVATHAGAGNMVVAKYVAL